MGKHFVLLSFFFLLAISCLSPKNNNSSTHIDYEQPLAGTDHLGRTLLQSDAVGTCKENKRIALFYFLVQGDEVSTIAKKHWDISKIVAEHPEVLEDYDSEYWGSPTYHSGDPKSVFHFWGEPIYGYYRGDDYWVHLKNMQLLADAMVDFLVIDVTNLPIYEKPAHALMQAMDTVRAQGKNPPQIVFYTNTRSGVNMQKIYDAFYKEGAPYYHPECWFQLDGKPLIIGISDQAKGTEYENFFTFRESQWPNEDKKVNGWPWITFTRQADVYYNDKNEKEIINVSIAQHPNYQLGMSASAFYGNKDNWGRSYRNGSHGNPETDIFYGYNFQEQWDYALEQNTPFIFVTGWNEWVAGRWESTDGNPEHSYFCDLANAEYSRDAEPTLTDGLGDNYYMQMVNNIRRYKGVSEIKKAGPEKTIKRMEDWTADIFTYIDYIKDTTPRHHPAAVIDPEIIYINQTGRNDFHILKVARDQKMLYFYVQTVDDITPPSADNWMQLYLDTDRNHQSGWNGYDYRIVEGNSLECYTDNSWKKIQSVKHEIKENEMMITIPLEFLNISSSALDFEFKWSDNMQQEDPLDWYINGDVAPGGRFNYIYTVK